MEKRHGVMDFSWIWGVLTGIILSPLTVLFYYKMKKRVKWLEVSFTIIFLLVILINYFIHVVYYVPRCIN